MNGKDPVSEMGDLVFSHMKSQEDAGKLSKAHSFDHVSNVSHYAGKLAPYFGRQLGVQQPEQLVPYAQMAGFSHDLIRYASQTDAGEDASARLLASYYPSHFASLVGAADFDRFVVDIVRKSDQSFPDMRTTYANDPEALAVALAVVAGDKLLEASGPRVLERKSFFVGRERMLNPTDLGAVFTFPEESVHGILTETMVRLGSINHVSNYDSDPALLALAQRLHSPQYHWYAGMLQSLEMDSMEALKYLSARLNENPATIKLAQRLEKGGSRLVDEDHLNGNYFREHGMEVLHGAVAEVPGDVMESSVALIHAFTSVDSPEKAVAEFESRPDGPVTYQAWMRDIAAYRRGELDFLEGL